MKLLPNATDSAIIKPRTSVISADKLVPILSNKKAEDQEKTIVIKEKLTTIAGLLEGTLASKKKEENDRKKEEQQERRSKREAKLEKKPKDTGGKLDLPKVPGMSFLDRIKQFLMNVLGGYLLYRLVEFAPLLKPILTGLIGIGEWLINFGGKILNGLVTFIDWGYKAYDWTRGQVKNIFGEEGAKKFDDFAGLVNKLLNGALIGAMVAIKIAEGVNKQAARTAGGKVAAGVAARGAGRVITRTALRIGGEKLARTAAVKGTQKLVSGAVSIIKPLVKRVPIIGGIIEFVLSMIAGDPVGKAAFRGVGSGLGMWLGGALGTILGPGIGTWIGGALGGTAGAELGGLLYDAIFKDKQPQPAEIQGRQEGGQIKPLDITNTNISNTNTKLINQANTNISNTNTNTKLINQANTNISNTKLINQANTNISNRTIIKPNYAKGNQQIPQVRVDDDKSKFASPTKAFSQIDYFGPVLATATKVLAGDDPSQSDYKSIGAGFNNLLLKGFQDGKLKSNLAIAYSDGGIVSADSLKDAPKASANFSEWVGNTFKELFGKNKSKIEQSKEEKTTETVKGATTIEKLLTQTIQSMAGISPQTMEPGSTYGPGSTSTVRDSATGTDISTDVPQVVEGGWGPVLNLIYKYEAGRGGYEAMYPSTTLPGATKMTIAEVASKATGAVGAWQNLPEYLNDRARAVGLDPNTALYNAENQKKIAEYLIGPGQANVTKDMARKNPKEAMLRLSKVWAAIPKDDSGTSYYAGVGNNAAHIKPQQMYNAFQRLQFGGEVSGQQGIDKVPAMLTSGEFVIDKDSTMAIQTAFPGFLSAINRAEGQKAVEILMNYASYNDPTAGEVVIIDRKEVIASTPQKEPMRTTNISSASKSNFKEILSFIG